MSIHAFDPKEISFGSTFP